MLKLLVGPQIPKLEKLRVAIADFEDVKPLAAGFFGDVGYSKPWVVNPAEQLPAGPPRSLQD